MKKLGLRYDSESDDPFDKIICEKLKSLNALGESVILVCWPRYDQLKLNFDDSKPAGKSGDC